VGEGINEDEERIFKGGKTTFRRFEQRKILHYTRSGQVYVCMYVCIRKELISTSGSSNLHLINPETPPSY
jgi:hypothetical protein